MSESTLGIVENWFNSKYDVKIGKDKWDVKKVRGEMGVIEILSEGQIWFFTCFAECI